MATPLSTPGSTGPIVLAPASAQHDPANEPELRAAAARIAPELAAMADDDVDTINVGITLAYWPTFAPHIADVVQLPTVTALRMPRLRDYALAMNHWHSVVKMAQAPAPDLSGAVDAGVTTRDRIVKDLSALAAHGLLEANAFASIGGTASYRKVGQDLIDLGTLIHARWSDIGAKSLLSLSAADDAIRQGQEILRTMVERDRAPTNLATASLLRSKAFTLFSRTYDDARQALLFLRRREGDVDSILPTLYPGRGASKKRSDERTAEPTPTEPGTPNGPTHGAPATATEPPSTGAGVPKAFANDAFDP